MPNGGARLNGLGARTLNRVAWFLSWILAAVLPWAASTGCRQNEHGAGGTRTPARIDAIARRVEQSSAAVKRLAARREGVLPLDSLALRQTVSVRSVTNAPSPSVLFRIEGIIQHETRPLVMIGGGLYGVGDAVLGLRISRIDPDRVEVTDENGARRVVALYRDEHNGD